MSIRVQVILDEAEATQVFRYLEQMGELAELEDGERS